MTVLQCLGFSLMPPHGSTCGCGLCVTLGRVHFFVSHPARDPCLQDVAALRLRVFYTQLVYIAEGFAPAPELPGSPFLPDPRPPPGTGAANSAARGADIREPVVAPGPVEAEESVPATTPKARPAVPVGHLAGESEAPQPLKEELPRKGERKEESEKPESAPSKLPPPGGKEARVEGERTREKSRSEEKRSIEEKAQ